MDLSKSDKKTARILIDKGIQGEFRNALTKAEQILAAWRAGGGSDKDAYLELFSHIDDCDKQISWRYDRLSGSNYLYAVAVQYRDGLLTGDDLELLSEQPRNEIRFLVQQWNERAD